MLTPSNPCPPQLWLGIMVTSRTFCVLLLYTAIFTGFSMLAFSRSFKVSLSWFWKKHVFVKNYTQSWQAILWCSFLSPMASFEKDFSFLIIYSKKGACLNYPIAVHSSRLGQANWNYSLTQIGWRVQVRSARIGWCVIAYEINGPKEATGRLKLELKSNQGLRRWLCPSSSKDGQSYFSTKVEVKVIR